MLIVMCIQQQYVFIYDCLKYAIVTDQKALGERAVCHCSSLLYYFRWLLLLIVISDIIVDYFLVL